jgi:hypothetical protein
MERRSCCCSYFGLCRDITVLGREEVDEDDDLPVLMEQRISPKAITTSGFLGRWL